MPRLTYVRLDLPLFLDRKQMFEIRRMLGLERPPTIRELCCFVTFAIAKELEQMRQDRLSKWIVGLLAALLVGLAWVACAGPRTQAAEVRVERAASDDEIEKHERQAELEHVRARLDYHEACGRAVIARAVADLHEAPPFDDGLDVVGRTR